MTAPKPRRKHRKQIRASKRRLPAAELAELAGEVLTGAVAEVKASMEPVAVAATVSPAGAVAVTVTPPTQTAPPAPPPSAPAVPDVPAELPPTAGPDLPPVVAPPAIAGGGPAFTLRTSTAAPVSSAPAPMVLDAGDAAQLAEAEAATPPPPPEKPVAAAPDRCTPERARELTRALLAKTMRGGAAVILRRRTKKYGFGAIDTWRFVPYPTDAELEPLYQKVPPEIEAFVRRHPEWFALPEIIIDLIDYGERAATVCEERMMAALERREKLQAAAKARTERATPPTDRGAMVATHAPTSDGGASVLPFTSNPSPTPSTPLP